MVLTSLWFASCVHVLVSSPCALQVAGVVITQSPQVWVWTPPPVALHHVPVSGGVVLTSLWLASCVHVLISTPLTPQLAGVSSVHSPHVWVWTFTPVLLPPVPSGVPVFIEHPDSQTAADIAVNSSARPNPRLSKKLIKTSVNDCLVIM
jgi:hypothetical protein